MEKTGIWTWPDRYSELKIIEVKTADLAYIKSLLVAWDITELGAPGFMTKEGEWLYEVFEELPQKEWLLSLFVNQANLGKEHQQIVNPYSGEISQDIVEEALYGLVCKETKQQLLEERIIELEIDQNLQQLWDSCWLGSTGFDPKRGFRLSNLQDVIDPKKQLSKGQITKERKRYKGLLFLYLQLFVQQANLAIGFYHSYDGWNWHKGRDFGIAEEYTRHEWWLGVNTDFFKGISNYIHLMSSLPSLLDHLCAKEALSYGKIGTLFNFDLLFQYDGDNIYKPNISLEEILLKALDYFPEEKTIADDQEGFPFILLLVRIYNAQGNFKAAQSLLEQAKLDIFTIKQLDFFCSQPNKYQQIAFYESCIAKMVLTGNYDLWRFPEYPKFTKAEVEKFDLYEGALFLDAPNDRAKYEAEQKKIERLIQERGTLAFDMREFLHYSYSSNLDLIYDDLEKKNARTDLDEIWISIIGQINFLSNLDSYKH